MRITKSQLRKLIAESVRSSLLMEGPSESEVMKQLGIKASTHVIKFKLQKPGQGIKRVKDKLAASCKKKGKGSPIFKTAKFDNKVYIVCVMEKK